MVSCCRLLGVRSFFLEVWSWSSDDVPVNLYQMNVILCPDQKVQSPTAQLSHSKVPVLVKRRQLLQGQVPTPCPAVIPEGARHPTQLSLSLLRPPKWERPSITHCNSGSQPLLLGHRNRDGGEVHHSSRCRPKLEEGLSEGPAGLQDVAPV